MSMYNWIWHIPGPISSGLVVRFWKWKPTKKRSDRSRPHQDQDAPVAKSARASSSSATGRRQQLGAPEQAQEQELLGEEDDVVDFGDCEGIENENDEFTVDKLLDRLCDPNEDSDSDSDEQRDKPGLEALLEEVMAEENISAEDEREVGSGEEAEAEEESGLPDADVILNGDVDMDALLAEIEDNEEEDVKHSDLGQHG